MSTTKVIDSETYVTSTAYDHASRPNKLVYPNSGINLTPFTLRKSFTYDQGKEMSQHKTLAADLGLQVFSCHPPQPMGTRHLRKPKRAHPSRPA